VAFPGSSFRATLHPRGFLMRGSVCWCALAFSLAILQPGLSPSQSGSPIRVAGSGPVRASDPADLKSDLAFGTPRPLPLPIPEPIRGWPPAPVSPPGIFGLPQLARSAGMIFSGTVTAVVRPHETAGEALGTVSITFHVENAIRGATPGEDLTVTQWVGLWSSGQRYRIGERAVFFFYPPSKLGLTSCVGGAMGRFAIDPLNRILFTAQQLSAFRRDPVLGGKSRVSYSDFARAVRRAAGEEWTSTTTRR